MGAPRPRDSSQSKAILSAALAGLAIAALYLMFVLTAAGQRLDDAAMRSVAISRAQAGWTEIWLEVVSAHAVAASALTVTAIAALSHRPLRVLAVPATIIATLVGSQVLQAALPRPHLFGDAATNSFPSGHVAAVAGVAAAMMIAAPTTAVRIGAAPLALAVVGGTGAATVVAQWHRPSDVLASICLAWFWGSVALLAGSAKTTAPASRPQEARRRDLVN